MNYWEVNAGPSRPVVYIASPYSSNPEQGVQRSVDVWHYLEQLGFHPIAPLLMHFMQPQPDAIRCMVWDLHEVRRADAVLRLPGHSPGADREVEEARAIGVPVFYSIETLRGNFAARLPWLDFDDEPTAEFTIEVEE